MATKKAKAKVNKNPARKVGQIWRVGASHYPFYNVGSDWEIVSLDESRWSRQRVTLYSEEEDRERTIDRRRLTTSGGLFSFVGVATGDERPWTVFCSSCESGRVVVARRPPRSSTCPYCS